MRCSKFVRHLQVSALALGIAAIAAPAGAATITIDGDLSDWGALVADHNGSNFSSLATNIGLQTSFVEDQDDEAGDGGYVGPNQGGQNYDGEFLGVALQNTTLYLAIASGQRPDNGLARYAPGDIRLTIDGTDYGIEVGGGVGGGSGTAITENADGATYNLKSNGFTDSFGTTDSAQKAGTVWSGANWINDPISPPTPTQMQITGTSTQVGTADYIFTRNDETNQHSIIELALDVSGLIDEDGSDIGIYWSPSCGNDVVQAFFTASNETVPEPASAMVWLAAFGAAAGMRYRQKRRRA